MWKHQNNYFGYFASLSDHHVHKTQHKTLVFYGHNDHLNSRITTKSNVYHFTMHQPQMFMFDDRL